MSAPWWDGPLVGLDLETTAPSPEDARIVTAALVTVGPAEHDEVFPGGVGEAVPLARPRDVQRRTWLADPGIPIPEEATAVHGITTEHARAAGRSESEVVAELADALDTQLFTSRPEHVPPLIVFNARYDLTVLARAAERLGWRLPDGFPWRVVDPFVLDKWLDRYRKSYPHGHTPESAKAAGIPSSRTLEGMCAHYRATLDGAHDAAFDALAGVRLAYRIASSAEPVRRVRGAEDARELAALKRTWADVRGNVDRLHGFQRSIALEERARFAEYKRSIGEHEEAARIEAEVGWPVLEPVAA